MEKASKIVSAAVLGKDFETVFVNGKAYVIHPPTIHKIAGAGYYLSDLKDGITVMDMLRSLKDVDTASRALSWLIRWSDRGFSNRSFNDFCWKFLQAVSFSQERCSTDSKATVVGNNCLLGQIATFMENLHLSYDEVVYKIPYRNMVIIQKDKLHTVYGEVMEEVSEEEFFKTKGKNPLKQ